MTGGVRNKDTLTLWPYKIHRGTERLRFVRRCMFLLFLQHSPHLGSPVDPLELRLSSPGSFWNLLHDWNRPDFLSKAMSTMKLTSHKEFIYSVTFARCHTQTRSHSGINSLMYVRHGLPHIFNMSVSLHTFNSLTSKPLIVSALHIRLSHTSMLALPARLKQKVHNLKNLTFVIKYIQKVLKVPSCQLAC